MPIQDPSTRDNQWEGSPPDVVRKLQFLLDTNRLTVMSLAEGTGITKKIVQDILDGASLPTESMLRKFAEFFGVSLEFILGRDDGPAAKRGSGATAKRGSGATRPPSTARAAPGKGSSAPPRGSPAGAKRTKGAGSLNIRAIATRHQALVELLVEKGVLSARDYHEMVQKIDKRGR